LPETTQSGVAAVNRLKIWYANFGDGDLVILLHGVLANSNYWGH
jgi:pimeloyl-ACP methyl ester carboxylesterase